MNKMYAQLGSYLRRVSTVRFNHKDFFKGSYQLYKYNWLYL